VDTFFWYGKFTTLCDLHWFAWLVSWALWHILDELDDFVSFQDFTEDNVLAIEVAMQLLVWQWIDGEGSLRGSGGSDEELGAIGILSCVGHAHQALLGVLQLEVLIGELGAVDCCELAQFCH
jgi:hypothetical protein